METHRQCGVCFAFACRRRVANTVCMEDRVRYSLSRVRDDGAWRELLCGHVGAAFSEHAMFWSVPLLYLYILADGRLFKNTLLNYGVLIAIGVGFLVVWGVHLFC